MKFVSPLTSVIAEFNCIRRCVTTASIRGRHLVFHLIFLNDNGIMIMPLIFLWDNFSLETLSVYIFEILHSQKHSPLHNRFIKLAIFFIFVIFHSLCRLIILSSPLSVNRYNILNIFY